MEIVTLQGGRCAQCDCKLDKRTGCEINHIIPLAKGGADERDNYEALCRSCHREITAKEHAGQIAKAKRMDQREAGIRKQSRNPLPGSRGSGVRKKMNGSVVIDPKW